MRDTGSTPKLVRETTEQWDDVPAKVVGRRKQGLINLERGSAFLAMGRERCGGNGRPKGVFRYASHEEANQWQTIPPKIG